MKTYSEYCKKKGIRPSKGTRQMWIAVVAVSGLFEIGISILFSMIKPGLGVFFVLYWLVFMIYGIMYFAK